MTEFIQDLVLRLGVPIQTMLVLGFSLGSLMVFVGVASVLTRREPAALRLASTAAARRRDRLDRGLLRAPSEVSGGLMKSFLPKDVAQRGALARKLSQAGLTGPHALRNFTLVRVMIGLVLPSWLLLMVFASRATALPFPNAWQDAIVGFSTLQIFQGLTLLVAVGYYGPLFWLNGRVAERKLRISESFPNALDLLQVSVEAGLGFDAAMTRVGNEMAEAAPELAYEFLSTQYQIQAGRPRDIAMREMAERTDVDVVRSFANLVQQSIQFGTPMAEALSTYAVEMRLFRELKAQDMANKLPVKLSGVMATLMLPALVMLTIGPVAIRYVNMVSQ